jgi:ribosomal protein S21
MGNMLARRPELFGAVLCQVPLLDMKRYHKLLAGASWMGEYGNPDVPEEWSFIQGYSPYHMLKEGVKYPRTLFTTSTRDDRVHPGHARKMAAKMKEMGLDLIYYENAGVYVLVEPVEIRYKAFAGPSQARGSGLITSSMASRQRLRRISMGVRVEVAEGEPIADAILRFKRLLREDGGYPISQARWHKKRYDRYQKPSVYRRRRHWVAVERRIRGWGPGPMYDPYYTWELRPRRYWSRIWD